jgi:hypothetical protein
MIAAMLLLRREQRQPSSAASRRRGRLLDGAATTPVVLLCCAALAFVTFCTASGAYARRPCQYGEWPQLAGCGSLWSPRVTFLYTAFSRTLWAVAVSVLLFLLCRSPDHHPSPRPGSGRCTTANGEPDWDDDLDDDSTSESCSSLVLTTIRTILSLPVWRLPSRLSFAMYLMHPIWLFVGQLGAPSSKYAWRWTTFFVQYSSACAVTLLSSYAVALAVEVPCARLWKGWVAARADDAAPSSLSMSVASRGASPPTQGRLDASSCLPPPPPSTPARGDLCEPATRNYGSIGAGVSPEP